MSTVLIPAAVLPDRHEPGIDKHKDLEDGMARPYKARPLLDVISTRYSTYAHLLLYHVPGEAKWPRINKPALTECRELGLDPMISLTALDYDNADHEPWKDKVGYLNLLKKIKDTPGLQLPTFVWRTRAGARLLFVHPPVKPEQAEALHEHLREHYTSYGIPMDAKVWEWARPHGLPWVVRDEVPLDPEPVLQFDPITILPDLPERRVRTKINTDTLRADQPDAPEAMALVWKEGSDKLTEWGAWAKKRLAGADCEVAFDPNTVPELEVKLRNPTLFQWAGAISHSLFGRKGTTATHVYGVLYPTIEANMRDGLPREIWRGICYCWAQEEGKRAVDKEESKTFLESLRSSMREWCQDTPEGEEEFSQWVRSRLVIAHGGDYYVLRPDGRYQVTPTKHANLVASMRTSGLVGAGRVLAELASKDGSPIRCQDVVDRFCTPVGEALIQGGALVGGTYRPTPTGTELVLTTFARRSDIQAEPSEWCQGWTGALWGEHLPTFEEWVSCALNFEGGPTCALSLVGKRGVGKDLTMWGLAGTTTSKTFSTADQAIGHFKPKIHKTPWVWFNESAPSDRQLHSKFRELVGGHLLESNQKHRQQQDVAMCARVLMTANKPVIMERLFSDPNMTDTEQEATAERVIHIAVGMGGRKWIEEHGGKDRARRAIETEELARHFLWLWETVPRSRHVGRFQISGDPTNPYLRSLGFAAIAAVGETLVRMVEAGKLTNVCNLKAGKVLDFSDNLLLTSRARDLTLVSVGRALARFCKPDRTPDMRKLWEFATATGLDAPVLRQCLVRAKKASKSRGGS